MTTFGTGTFGSGVFSDPSATFPTYSAFNPPVVDDFNRADGALGANWSAESVAFYSAGIVNTNAYAPANAAGGSASGGSAYIAPGPKLYYDFGVSYTAAMTTGQFIIESINQAGISPTPAPWQGFAAIFRANDATSGFIDIYEFVNDSPNYVTTAVDAAGTTRVAPFVIGSQLGMRVKHNGWEVYSRDSAVDTWRLNYTYAANSQGLSNVGLSYACLRWDNGVNSTARMDDFRYQELTAPAIVTPPTTFVRPPLAPFQATNR
jgi:hypothetical protein